MKLSTAERRFLAVIHPTGTIALGSEVGFRLYQRGLVTIAKFGRYGITPAGAEAIKEYPESEWKIPQIKVREWQR